MPNCKRCGQPTGHVGDLCYTHSQHSCMESCAARLRARFQRLAADAAAFAQECAEKDYPYAGSFQKLARLAGEGARFEEIPYDG
jgi:hypothetical protein